MPSRACGDDDAAQRAAVVYSLLATCKARGVDERAWLEDVDTVPKSVSEIGE